MLLTMFQRVVLNFVMFMLISNEPIKNCAPSKISQSINGEWHNCDRNGNNYFSKSNKNFGRLMKRGMF